MNIINKALLALALSPSRIYRRMGVDTFQLRTIVTTKLLIDDRRPNTIHQTQRNKQKKPVSLATIGTMIMSALLGLLFLLFFSYGANTTTGLTLYFTVFFLMLSATLISDFTSVLIDIRDTFIILPKPVNDRTFIVARFLHIFIHICKIVLPMSIPGMVYIAINYQLGGWLLFSAMVIMVTAFAIFFINAVYILILRITTPERFKSIISYVQIIFAILMYGSYQLVPRMASRYNLFELDLTHSKWVWALPTYWVSTIWALVYEWNTSLPFVIGACLGFVLPFLSLYVVVRYLAPSFNNKLALITSSGSEGPSAVTKEKHKTGYAEKLAHLFTRSHVERMGFLFTWKMTSRSRDFKIKVYPSMGYLAVYVVVMFMNSRSLSLEQIREQGLQGKVIVLSAIYLSSLLLTMAISQMVYSEKYKASWIYHVSPVQQPGAIILGAAKGAMMKFFIPVMVFILLAALLLIGPSVLLNVVLGLSNQLLIATMLVYAGFKYFPFSLHQSNAVKAGSQIRGLLVLLMSGLIGFGHFAVYDLWPVVLLCIVLSWVAIWLLMDSIRKTSWAAVKSIYMDAE